MAITKSVIGKKKNYYKKVKHNINTRFYKTFSFYNEILFIQRSMKSQAKNSTTIHIHFCLLQREI